MRKLLLLLMVGLVAWAAWALYVPVGPIVETFVVIPPRTDARGIAALLKQRGLISNEVAFLGWRAWKHGTLKAGEYRFDHPASLPEVYDRLQRGDVYTLSVTIPEGYNVFDTAAAFAAARLKPAAEFLAGATTNADLVKDLDPHAATLEGYLFPDTYRFPPAMSVRDMQAAMVRRFRQQTSGLGIRDYHGVVTMASLVEKETGVGAERPMVARVFDNRLQRQIALATDPSVIYGLLVAGRYRGTIYASDLKAETAYNTYLHTGLPPGPICSPGLASFAAVLHPAESTALYFVADARGHSRFAETLEEHNRNVAQYRRDLQRGSASQQSAGQHSGR